MVDMHLEDEVAPSAQQTLLFVQIDDPPQPGCAFPRFVLFAGKSDL
jgi:hypothetical protein